MPTFLCISPHFMPSRLIGARRTLHFCRHLPARGWHPAVVALPAHLHRDPALDAWLPPVPILRVGRVREAPPYAGQAHGPSGLTQVLDRYTWPLLAALPAVLRFTRHQRCGVIYATSGPPSALLLGRAVHRATGLPLVVDLRDPWQLEGADRRTPAAQRFIAFLEQQVLGAAAHILLNTEAAHRAYMAHYRGRIPAERFGFIRNAFEPTPPAPPPSTPPDRPLRLIYFGHLRASKDARLFFTALQRFIHQRGLAPGQLELLLLGEVPPADAAAERALGLGPFVRRHPWVSPPEAPALLATADGLIDLMGPTHTLQISGKLYDYLAAERPILAVSPNPELDGLLAQTGAGERVALDLDAIVAGLERLATRAAFRPNPDGRAAFTASEAAAQLADVLDAVGKSTANSGG